MPAAMKLRGESPKGAGPQQQLPPRENAWTCDMCLTCYEKKPLRYTTWHNILYCTYVEILREGKGLQWFMYDIYIYYIYLHIHREQHRNMWTHTSKSWRTILSNSWHVNKYQYVSIILHFSATFVFNDQRLGLRGSTIAVWFNNTQIPPDWWLHEVPQKWVLESKSKLTLRIVTWTTV